MSASKKRKREDIPPSSPIGMSDDGKGDSKSSDRVTRRKAESEKKSERIKEFKVPEKWAQEGNFMPLFELIQKWGKHPENYLAFNPEEIAAIRKRQSEMPVSVKEGSSTFINMKTGKNTSIDLYTKTDEESGSRKRLNTIVRLKEMKLIDAKSGSNLITSEHFFCMCCAKAQPIAGVPSDHAVAETLIIRRLEAAAKHLNKLPERELFIEKYGLEDFFMEHLPGSKKYYPTKFCYGFGINLYDNAWPICTSCNTIKSAKILLDAMKKWPLFDEKLIDNIERQANAQGSSLSDPTGEEFCNFLFEAGSMIMNSFTRRYPALIKNIMRMVDALEAVTAISREGEQLVSEGKEDAGTRAEFSMTLYTHTAKTFLDMASESVDQFKPSIPKAIREDVIKRLTQKGTFATVGKEAIGKLHEEVNKELASMMQSSSAHSSSGSYPSFASGTHFSSGAAASPERKASVESDSASHSDSASRVEADGDVVMGVSDSFTSPSQSSSLIGHSSGGLSQPSPPSSSAPMTAAKSKPKSPDKGGNTPQNSSSDSFSPG